jgi:AsmA protein
MVSGRAPAHIKEQSMFLVSFIVLLLAWMLGFAVFNVGGALIHLLLLLSLISLVVHLMTSRRVVLKRIGRVLAITLGLLAVAVVSLPFLINANQFRPMLESKLSQGLGRVVKLGDLKFSLLAGSVTASDLSIADNPAFSNSPFVRAKSLTVSAKLWPFIFSRQLIVTGLTIDQPEIVLLQSAPGQWNYSNLGAQSASIKTDATPTGNKLDLSIQLIEISGGRLSVGRINSHSNPLVLDKVNFELRNFAPASVMPFTLTAKVTGGGDVKLSGKAGPIDTDDVVLTPVDASLKATNLDLTASGLMDSSSGIGGLVSVDGGATSNGGNLEVRGRVKADRLKLAKGGSPARRSVAFDFTVDHDLLHGSGSLRRGDVHIGSAVATLTGTYARHGESSILNANLSGRGMPIPELEAMLPALNVELPQGSSLQGGTASVKLAVAGALGHLTAKGSLSLDHTRLTGFDLGSKMAVVEMLAGIKRSPNTDIETLSANVATNPESTSIDGLTLVAPAIGELTGAGVIGANHALDFKMRVTLHTSGVVMAAVGHNGDTSVPFLVQGTASNPVFKPDMKNIASSALKSIASDQLNKLGGTNAGTAVGVLQGLLNRKKNQ